MKSKYLIFAFAMSLAVVACSPKAEAPADEAGKEEAVETIDPQQTEEVSNVITAQERKDVSYLIGVNFGSFIKGNGFGDKLNYCQIYKGMMDFINSKGNMQSPEFLDQFKVNPREMDKLFSEYIRKVKENAAEANKAEEEKFLKSVAKKAGVQFTESGLGYKIIEAGNDVHPAYSDTVSVVYKGTFANGEVFDSTEEPVEIFLENVIAGWQQGLPLIGEGGEIELYVPSALGYGEYGNMVIEGNKVLIFNVKIDRVGKFQKEVIEAEAE